MGESRDSLILVGCGGHGRVVLDSLLAAGFADIRIVDPALESNSNIFGKPVVAETILETELRKSSVALVLGVGATGTISRRNAILRKYSELGGAFQGVIHPTVYVGRESQVDISAQLLAGVILQSRVRIAMNCVVNTGVRIDHDCVVESSSFIGPGTVLCGGVSIDRDVFVGAGAVIAPGVKIGSGARIGAGAVVLDDVSSNMTMVGNPAAPLKSQT